MNGYKSILQSTSFWGNVVSLVAMFEPKLFALFGWTADASGQLSAVNFIVAAIGQAVSIYGRFTATKMVTLTGAPPAGK